MPEKKQNEIQKMDLKPLSPPCRRTSPCWKAKNYPRKALEVYERGQLLARRCAELLETAELRLRQLSQDATTQEPSER